MRISVARTLAMVVPSKSAAFYNKKLRATSSAFDPACRDCPRLAAHLDRIKREHPDYHARPVAPFGPAIAHRAVLMALGLAPGAWRFAHHAVYELPSVRLFDSYHCSRYNTQTKRLTAAMFEAVVRDIATFLRGAR